MDLVGYTALSSGLGPEATARLLACLFTEIDRAALAVTQACPPPQSLLNSGSTALSPSRK
jgi:hypothetical protein